MRRLIHTAAVIFLLGSSIVLYMTHHVPAPRVIAPTTRYHGYNLNRLAIDQAKAFTVLISNEDFGSVGRGTGVLIDATHVLTCAHVAEGSRADIWVFPYLPDSLAKGKVVFISRSNDLAVVELDHAVIIPHYATFMEMHYDGEPITIIGNTMGAMKWFVSFGIISGEFDGFLLTDGAIYGGNSGGPWINEQGEVVALTDWTRMHDGVESRVHGGISAKTIHEFLKVWKTPSPGAILQMLLGAGG